MAEPTFKIFRRYNDPDVDRRLLRVRRNIDPRALEVFTRDTVVHRVVRALARRRALPLKEVFESFEFFARVRNRVRTPAVADLCCGHGLTGLLLAAMEPKVEHVYLVDRERPNSHERSLEALEEVFPGLGARVTYLEMPLSRADREIPEHASYVGVHACGVRTDRIIEQAKERNTNVAVMPCCYFQTAAAAPRALRTKLGRPLTTDIHRTYLLEAAGYTVDWKGIPSAITPMNRILVGTAR